MLTCVIANNTTPTLMKAFCFCSALSFACALSAAGIAGSNAGHPASRPRGGGKRVAMVIAPSNFRDEELRVPLKAFRDAGLNVTVFSETVEQAKGMLGYSIVPDEKLSGLDVGKFDAIVFVGGSGAKVYWDSPLCHKICRDAATRHKVLAAICIAPVILARAGVLKGKTATVWPGVRRELVVKGVNYTARPVAVDDRIITADGPGSSAAFAREILACLNKESAPQHSGADKRPPTPASHEKTH